jgi:PAS domain S-box-containing protein
MEERFDRLIRLALRLFDAQIALISLVDSEGQWFHAGQGLPGAETAHAISFCDHAILEDGPLVIPDVLVDARLAHHPLVTGPPHIRFYAGQPLLGPGGHKVGALCIMDGHPRQMNPADLAALKDLAAITQDELTKIESNEAVARQQQTQAALAESEKRFRQLAENIDEVFWLFGLPGSEQPGLLYVSPAYERVFGRSCQSLYDQPLSYREAIHPEDLEETLAAVDTAKQNTHLNKQYRIIRPDGTIRWLWARDFPVFNEQGQLVRVAGVLQDITDLKNAEAALRQGNQLFQQFAENLDQVFWMTDASRRQLLYTSPAYEKVWGRSLESLHKRPRSFFEAIHPDDQEQVRVARRQQFDKAYEMEYRLIWPDGSIHWIWSRAFPVFNEQGEVYRIAGVAADISRRKQLEAELKSQRDFALQVMNAIGQGLAVSNAEGQFEYINPAYTRLFGYEAEALIGRKPEGMSLPENQTTLEAAWAARRQGKTTAYESNLRRADGSIAPVLVTGAPRWQDGQIVGSISLITDLTQQKQVEERLRDALSQAKALYSINETIIETRDLPETLQRVADTAVEALAADRVALIIIDSQHEKIEHFVKSGPGMAEVVEIAFAELWDGLSGWAIRQRQPALSPKGIADERESWQVRQRRAETHCGAILVVPVMYGEKLLGTLTAINRPEQPDFAERDADLLLALATQAAAVIEYQRTAATLRDREATLRQQNSQLEALYQQTEMAEARQRLLYEVLRGISDQHDPAAVTHHAVLSIGRFGGWPNISIALLSQDQRELAIGAASGTQSPSLGFRQDVHKGVIGRAIALDQTQYVPDVAIDPDYVPLSPAICSELAVPIRYRNRLLGVLNLESDELDAFSSNDRLMAESLADAVALALNNALLHQEVNAHLADLSILYSVAQMATRSLRLEEVLSEALQTLLPSLGFKAGLIALVEPQEQSLQLISSLGLWPELAAYLQAHPLDETVCAYAQEQQKSVVVADLLQSNIPGEATLSDAMVAVGVRAFTAAPLLHYRQSLGVVCLFSRQPRTSTASTSLLSAVGHQIAIAITNARFYQTVKQNQGQLQALIAASRDGIILIGLDQRVLVINNASLELLRLPGEPADWHGRPLRRALAALRQYSQAAVEATLAELRRIKRGDEPVGTGEYELPPRSIHWLNLPVMAGEMPLGRLLVLRDVTEERLVARMRDDLTNMMVHDLRNPLTSVLVGLKLLALTGEDNLSAEQQRMIAVGINGAERMLDLVNAILDVSRLESGQMPLERAPVQVVQLVEEGLELQAPLVAAKELTVSSHFDSVLPLAWADRKLIGRVLQNLIGNAVKFTPTGGSIQIRAMAESHGGLNVSVFNSGPGIPAELQGRLFQRFATGRQEGYGSGLGLAFCRLVVEAHGGRIGVESDLGQGATFYFTLPLVQQVVASHQDSSGGSSGQT